MTSFSFPADPFAHHAALRKDFLEAIRSNDKAKFKSVVQQGWTPFLHNDVLPTSSSSYSHYTPMSSQLARDLFDLAQKTEKSAEGVWMFLQVYPASLWDFAWRHSGSQGNSERMKMITREWASVQPVLKQHVMGAIPVGFCGQAQQLDAQEIIAMSLPAFNDHSTYDPEKTTPFFGFFESPFWQNQLALIQADPYQKHYLAKQFSALTHHLLNERTRSIKTGKPSITVKNIDHWIDYLDQLSASWRPQGQIELAERGAFHSAAFYALHQNEADTFKKIMAYLPYAKKGDEFTLLQVQSQNDKAVRSYTSELHRFFSLHSNLKSHEVPALKGSYESIFNTASHEIPWRLIAAYKQSNACLRSLDDWGPLPTSVATIGKQFYFRSPSGIVKKAEEAIFNTKQQSRTPVDQVKAVFDQHLKQSLHFISKSNLPMELCEALLRDFPDVLEQRKSFDPERTYENVFSALDEDAKKEQQALTLKAIKRVEQGLSFVFYQPLSFSWAALALSCNCAPATLKPILKTGDLSKAMEQINWLLGHRSWKEESLAIIEMDAIEHATQLATSSPAPSIARKNRL